MTQVGGTPDPNADYLISLNNQLSSNTVDSSILANNQAIVDSLSTADPNSIVGGRPNLSILEFSQTVSQGLLDKKEADKSFDLDDATSYRELHVSLTISASKLKDRLLALQSFQEDYNTFVSGSNAGSTANFLNNKYADIANVYNQVRSGADFYREWGNFSDARIRIYWGTQTQAQTDALIADYLQTRAIYNTRVNELNALIGQLNLSLQVNRAAQGPDVAKYNALITSLGINLPLITDLNNVPNLVQFQGPGTGAPPPPWPSTLFFDTPQSFAYDLLIYPPPAALPSFPTVQGPATLNNSNFRATYIKPVEAAIKALQDLLEQSKIDITTYTLIKLVFGQATPGEVESLPFANITTPVGTGGSSQLGAGAPNKAQNPNLAGNASQAQLDALFAKFGVGAGSALIALIGGVPEDLLEALRALAVPDATALANGALVGSTPGDSPAVGAAVAFSTINEAIKFLETGALEKAVLDKLLAQKPVEGVDGIPLAGLSEEDLVKLAKGIAAALSLEVIKLVVLDAAQAIGTSGLLPQLLASIGGVSSDTILKFINGLINYQLLNQSPLGLELVKNTFSQELQGSLGLDQQQADIIVGRALDAFLKQGPFDTEEASKTALRQSLLDAAIDSGASNEVASTLIDNGFNRIDNPPAPVSRNDSPPPPVGDNLELSPQQQLQDELKLTSFNDELKRELQNADLEKDEQRRISSNIDNSTRGIRSLDERKQIIEDILTNEGVDNPRDIIATVSNIVDSPLRNFIVPQPAPIQTLVDNFVFESSRLLVSQGIRSDVAAEQSENFAKLIFDNPTSIASLTTRYLAEYSEAVGVDQAKAVADNFSNVMLPTRDLAVALAKNQANGIVFASNPIINGTSSMARIGTGGGVPINPIIG